MPRTFGDSIIHQSHFDFAAHIDEPLPSHGGRGQTEQETKIGQLIAENLVDDGATLQMGNDLSNSFQAINHKKKLLLIDLFI